MSASSRLARVALKLVPDRWRDSVDRDLVEVAARRDLTGAARDRWIAWEALRVAIRFRTGRTGAIVPVSRERTRRMTGIGSDLRFAWRAIRWQPSSSLAIILTLALGIGATTAVFAVFNHLLFRPVPGVRDADRLITVRFRPPDQPRSMAYGHGSSLAAFRQQTPALASIGFANDSDLPVAFASDALAEFSRVEVVSSRYLDTLGVRARIGRLFTDDETDQPGHAVALISASTWHTRFAAQETVLGRTIAVNGHPFEIVGVVDAYRGWGTTRAPNRELWLPAATMRALLKSGGSISQLVGRLAPGATPEIAEQQLRASYRAISSGLAGDYAKYEPMVSPGLAAFEGPGIYDRLSRIFWLLLAAVGLLMLLACANAANLLLARGTARERDTAVRAAMGASRWRLIRQLLFESMALAAIAGALGLALSAGLLAAFRGTQLISSEPALGPVAIDPAVIAFGVAATTITLLVFGLLPSVLSARADLRAVVQQGGRSLTGRRRLRGALVAVQVAMSLVLLAGGGVLVRSLNHLYAVDLGMDPNGVVAARLMAHRIGYSDARADTLFRDAMSWLRTQGVAVAFSGQHPLERPFTAFDLELTPGVPRQRVRLDKVSPEFFPLMRIPFVGGRGFTDAEYAPGVTPAPLPVIANEAAIREWFGGDATLGRRFTLHASKTVEAELVGIIRDTRSMQPDQPAMARLYNPALSGLRGGYLVARGGSVGHVTQLLREAIQRLDPGLPFTEIGPADEAMASAMSEQRALAKLSTVVALLALFLAASGVWAMMSYVVTERTREFGIRLALGAPLGAVMTSVVRRAVWTTVLGAAMGLAIYWPSSRWLETRLFEISAVDPATLATAAAILLGAAIVAAWLPARRATRVDPVSALRAD